MSYWDVSDVVTQAKIEKVTPLVDRTVYPYSTTIGDYDFPVSVSFQDDFSGHATQGAADAAWPTSDTAKMRANITNDNLDFNILGDNTDDHISHDLGTALSDSAWVIRFKLRMDTITVGNASFFDLCVSSTDGAQNTNQDLLGFLYGDFSGPIRRWGGIEADGANAPVDVIEGTQNQQLNADTDYFVEIRRTSTTTYEITVYSDANFTTQVGTTGSMTCAATVTGLQYLKIYNRVVSTSGSIIGTIDDVRVYDGVTSVSGAVASSENGTNTAIKAADNDTATRWESNSEANPWIRFEMSATANKEPAAIALWPHANTTATQIKIQTSDDGSIWVDKRLINVSALTMGAYNYIRFNRDNKQMRYLRIYVPDGSAKVLAISELKIIKPTESQWNRRHGHVWIIATDSNETLSGE